VSRGPAPGTEPLPRTCRSKEALACADAGYATRRRSLSLWRDGPGLPWGHPDFVLASAVRRGILSAGQAGLIGRNRLEGGPLSQIAAERGISHTALCNQRKRGESQRCRVPEPETAFGWHSRGTP
jgi:hypothetical protein